MESYIAIATIILSFLFDALQKAKNSKAQGEVVEQLKALVERLDQRLENHEGRIQYLEAHAVVISNLEDVQGN